MVVGLPAFFNMAVVTALLPTKGLPLPFFSYGGTNLLVCFAAMGMLLNVAGQSRAAAPAKSARAKTAPIKAQPALAGASL
jgi:cell division protein FtsW